MMGARDDAAVAIKTMAWLVAMWGVGEEAGSAGLAGFMTAKAAGRGGEKKTATRAEATIVIVVALIIASRRRALRRVMVRGRVEAQLHYCRGLCR